MKALAAILLVVALQGRTLYEDPSRSIRVYGYDQAEGGTLENGDFEFAMSGKPAIVESRIEGLLVSGPKLSGVVVAASGSKRAFIRKLAVEDGSTIVLDGMIAYHAQVELAKRMGTPVPVEPGSQDRTVLKSLRFDYAGDAGAGSLTVPQSFTIESKSVGRSGEKTFAQTLTADGVNATLQISPEAKGAGPLQSGTIAGPVNLKILRTETAAAGAPATTSELTGVADQVEFDLAASRTITLRGNVRVGGFSGLYQGTSEGDQVVISLDESLKPVKIRITGNPLKSTLREGKPGGGRP